MTILSLSNEYLTQTVQQKPDLHYKTNVVSLVGNKLVIFFSIKKIYKLSILHKPSKAFNKNTMFSENHLQHNFFYFFKKKTPDTLVIRQLGK